MDDQRMGRAITTRHLDALKDLQKNENDRLQKIKNDPSRRLSRCYTNLLDESGVNETTKDSLPVSQVWAGALEASKLTVEKKVAVTKRDLLQHYQPVDTGYVKGKIGQWEKLIVLFPSSIEQVDTTVQAGCKRMSQLFSVVDFPDSRTTYVYKLFVTYNSKFH